MSAPANAAERVADAYMAIVTENDAVDAVRHDIETEDGSEVIWEIADTVHDVYGTKLAFDIWDVADDALRIVAQRVSGPTLFSGSE